MIDPEIVTARIRAVLEQGLVRSGAGMAATNAIVNGEESIALVPIFDDGSVGGALSIPLPQALALAKAIVELSAVRGVPCDDPDCPACRARGQAPQSRSSAAALPPIRLDI